jgi:hypothetical protein
LNNLQTKEIEALTKIKALDKPKVFKNTFLNVLSPVEFENLLNLTPFTNTLRFVPTFPNKNYDWQLPYWNTGTNNWPIDIVEEIINSGACYMRDCSRVNYKINKICSVLENEMLNTVDAHIYFSRDNSLDNGFGIHNDAAHNFIIQIEGTTHWKVGSNYYLNDEVNLSSFKDNDTLSIDTILEPGDAIFVPAYVYHSAKSLSKRISISFPMPAEKSTYFENRKWINWNA